METNLNYDENDTPVLSKTFWRHLKSINKSTRILESVYYNCRYRNNLKDQATLFNQFFVDKFSDSSSYGIDIDWSNDQEKLKNY